MGSVLSCFYCGKPTAEARWTRRRWWWPWRRLIGGHAHLHLAGRALCVCGDCKKPTKEQIFAAFGRELNAARDGDIRLALEAFEPPPAGKMN